MTREGAPEETFAGGIVLTALDDRRCSIATPARPETAPETTAETVSAAYSASVHKESRDAMYTRPQKLFHHGYLDRLGENPNAPLVYSVGRRGAEVLEVSTRKDVGDRYLAHQLMIGDFRIAMMLAARAHGSIFTWRSVGPDLPVRPDGFPAEARPYAELANALARASRRCPARTTGLLNGHPRVWAARNVGIVGAEARAVVPVGRSRRRVHARRGHVSGTVSPAVCGTDDEGRHAKEDGTPASGESAVVEPMLPLKATLPLEPLVALEARTTGEAAMSPDVTASGAC